MLKMRSKVLFISSSGGHYKQLRAMQPLIDKYNGVIVTENDAAITKKAGMYLLHQVNRKEKLFYLWLFLDAILELRIFIKERPAVIVTTGVLAAIPMCMIAKLFGRKVIYVESFAKIISPTKTGEYIYNHHPADYFFVQWESMQKVYPGAIYAGNLY